MGATIGVVCKSPKAASKLYDVISANLDPAGKIIGSRYPEYYGWWIENKNKVETKISAFFGQDRNLNMAIARWGAIKCGRKQSSFTDPKVKFDKPVPYTLYDSFDRWPVLLTKPKKELLWCHTNELGISDNKTNHRYLIEEWMLSISSQEERDELHIKIMEGAKSGKFFDEIVYDSSENARNFVKEKNLLLAKAMELFDNAWNNY